MKRLWSRVVGDTVVSLEFKAADLWVGAYWSTIEDEDGDRLGADLWVCLLPCFPIHVSIDWDAVEDLQARLSPRANLRRLWASWWAPMDLSGPWTKPWPGHHWTDLIPGIAGHVARSLHERLTDAVDRAILGDRRAQNLVGLYSPRSFVEGDQVAFEGGRVAFPPWPPRTP